MGWGAVVGSITGGLLSNYGAKESASQSFQYQKELYQNRYQWQRQDMEKAGYNPILGVYNGAGSAGSVNVDNGYSGMSSSLGAAGSAAESNRIAKRAADAQISLSENQGLQALAASQESMARRDYQALYNEIYKDIKPFIVEEYKNRAANSAKEGLRLDAETLSYLSGARYSNANAYEAERTNRDWDEIGTNKEGLGLLIKIANLLKN